MPTVSHDEGVAEHFRQDPAYAVELLNSVLQDGDAGELLVLLRHMTKAFGGVQAVAEKADLNPTQLYRTLSADGNPTLSSLTAVLKAMGLQLTIGPLKSNEHETVPETVGIGDIAEPPTSFKLFAELAHSSHEAKAR